MSSYVDYKASKEAFVSGMTGSTIFHINMVSSVALASIALHSCLRSRLPPTKSLQLPIELLLLVAPLLLSMTLFALTPGLLILVLIFPTALLLLLPARELGTPLPSNADISPRSSPVPSHRLPRSPPNGPSTRSIIPLPALSTYRAHMMLMTILAILAVDFPVFPRSLAKCETYGVSLMDIGVGSFVFSQGIVSAIPLIRDPIYLKSPIIPKAIHTLKKCAPILILGIVRVLLVKGTEYPEHVTEYGVHWNFFLTLGIIPVLQVLLHPLISRVPVALIGIAVALCHQFGLSHGLKSYVLNAPRSNLINANKEGIVSLTGYFAIHLLGLSTGTLILPPSPSFFRRRQQKAGHVKRESESEFNKTPPRSIHRENDKTATELFSYTFIWWTLLGATRLVGIGGEGVSRRLVNLPYIFWVAAYNTSFILGYLLLDLYFFPSPLSKSVYSPTSKLKVHADASHLLNQQQEVQSAPALLEAINRNGLAIFLLANVATGLVNLSMSTMHASDASAMTVLTLYASVICLFAWAMRGRRVWRL
ncbi:GWT1-domain-containing protein [Artomyces pyxidatus]|uniref:GWT1-domain-containing protein n=1 Tax=Artomyces pyxidatus TaxID=48021 RepID=A0ACB8T1Z5_9AGAM|nr:GWT1-domain-containing protein [Artomyces pyxidatus]